MEMDAAHIRGQGGEMNEREPKQEPDNPPMHVREIRLDDGRYMIFFTFGDEDQEEDV